MGGQNLNFAQPAEWIREIEVNNQSDDSREGKKSSQAWFKTADDSMRKRDWDLAAQAYLEALKLEPGTLLAVIGVARALIASKQYAATLEFLKPWLEAHRENGELLSIAGVAHVNLGRLDAAEKNFRDAVYFEPFKVEARLALVLLARNRNDWTTVLRELRIIARSSNDGDAVWAQLAEAYLQLGRPLKALENVERVLVKDPANADALLWKGIALYYLRRYQESITTLKHSLLGKPSQPVLAWITLGDAHYDHRLWPEAIGAYREATNTAPSNVMAQQRLGVALKDGGHFVEALALFEKLNREKSDDPFSWRQIGFVHAYMDQASKAIPAYQRSLELDSKQPRCGRRSWKPTIRSAEKKICGLPLKNSRR